MTGGLRVGRMFAGAGLLCAIIAVALWRSHDFSAATVAMRREAHPQTTWAACNRNARNRGKSTFHPLSDRAAAALVTPEPEVRPDNDKPYSIDGVRYPAANDYVPTAGQVAQFRRAKSAAGQTQVQFNPYYQYVDGRDGMRNPTTDDLIQWAAHKWGIPEDWLRAEYVRETYWNHFLLGDESQVSPSWYKRYPVQARVPHSSNVFESMGLTQVRWAPYGVLHPGTEPLRWRSMAFNVDYQAATLRFYYDNPEGSRTAWNDSTYQPCQQWNSVGAWFSPYPWNNAGQADYAHSVQQILAQRGWTSTSFVDWSPSSLPRGLKFR